mgnify:CR=1 FL=1
MIVTLICITNNRTSVGIIKSRTIVDGDIECNVLDVLKLKYIERLNY